MKERGGNVGLTFEQKLSRQNKPTCGERVKGIRSAHAPIWMSHSRRRGILEDSRDKDGECLSVSRRTRGRGLEGGSNKKKREIGRFCEGCEW